jgi:hypothetical protein
LGLHHRARRLFSTALGPASHLAGLFAGKLNGKVIRLNVKIISAVSFAAD